MHISSLPTLQNFYFSQRARILPNGEPEWIVDFLAWAVGGVEKAARVFVANELEPLQATLLEINERVNEMIVRFRPYVLEPVNPTPVNLAL